MGARNLLSHRLSGQFKPFAALDGVCIEPFLSIEGKGVAWS